jgi:NADH:ubiquinone oxidoreductase subunit 2 (subunit N)
MMLGATVGAAQRGVRRMLAYASIGARLPADGDTVGQRAGKSAMLFYLPACGLASISAFDLARC